MLSEVELHRWISGDRVEVWVTEIDVQMKMDHVYVELTNKTMEVLDPLEANMR